MIFFKMSFDLPSSFGRGNLKTCALRSQKLQEQVRITRLFGFLATPDYLFDLLSLWRDLDEGRRLLVILVL